MKDALTDLKRIFVAAGIPVRADEYQELMSSSSKTFVSILLYDHTSFLCKVQ